MLAQYIEQDHIIDPVYKHLLLEHGHKHLLLAQGHSYGHPEQEYMNLLLQQGHNYLLLGQEHNYLIFGDEALRLEHFGSILIRRSKYSISDKISFNLNLHLKCMRYIE